jgi:hypothetical protein
MRECTLCLVVYLLLTPVVKSQYYFYDATHLEPRWKWETGLSVGVMNCLTDLGGHKGKGGRFIKDVNWKNTLACFGIMIGVSHQDIIALRLEATFGQVTASDEILKDEDMDPTGRYWRNLSFRSKIAEGLAGIEFYPVPLLTASIPKCSPYLLAGVGYFHFEPKAYVHEEWVKLKPLHTEGQGFTEYSKRQEYRLNQFNFPLGFGLKYEVSARSQVRLEFVYRMLTTDYLDDVSTDYIDERLYSKYFAPARAELATSLSDRRKELDPFHQPIAGEMRGNPENKDSYFSFCFKWSVVLNRKRL